MKFDPSWDMCGLSVPQWVDLTMRLKAGLARRIARQRTDSLGLLDWSRRYLPQHFRRPPSAMHLWLGEQLDAMVSDAVGWRVIEFGGQYAPPKLRDFHDFCQARSLRYEIW